jgi:hypothetical protein
MPATLAVRRDATTNATYHEERSMQQQSFILYLLHRVIHVLPNQPRTTVQHQTRTAV